ncbi:hypothetical protein [Neobacillus drentensis]|uniref:hypothetical protein n=1 Tax=Neobacillus drentensis TaxID=220684 RepID=UPI002FFF7D6C
MIVTFYFTLSWMMTGFLTFNRKESRGSREEILFLVLLTCLINTHTYLGLFETFKWIKTATTPKLYLAFLLFRSAFIPVFVSYLTLHIVNNTWKKQILLFLLYLLVIIGTDKINVYSDLYTFKHWNHMSTIIYYLLYLALVVIAFKWFQGLKIPEVKNANEVGRK